MRDEEKFISECLDCLINQDYPKENPYQISSTGLTNF